MVGRIIVGKATGPGAEPFDYFKGMLAGGGLARCAWGCTKSFSFDRDNLERKGGASSWQPKLTVVAGLRYPRLVPSNTL